MNKKSELDVFQRQKLELKREIMKDTNLVEETE